MTSPRHMGSVLLDGFRVRVTADEFTSSSKESGPFPSLVCKAHQIHHYHYFDL